jgi:hypothetical protein
MNEYYLSFDVGIKNLAFCLFQKEREHDKDNLKSYKIVVWDVINLIQNENENETICLEKDKKGNICNKKGVYTAKNNKCYCLKHSKKSEFIIPIPELKKTKLNKLNINQLKEIATKYYIHFEINIKKKDLMELIHTSIHDKMLEPIPTGNKCKDYSLIDLTKKINSIFNILFQPYLSNLKCVCIELQMTSKMRCLSFIIMQYFLVKNNTIDIKMVNPCFKLKDLEDEKTDYSNRKKNAVKHCLHILIENHNFNNWVDFLKKNKKCDDLSDSFLQGIYVVTKML